MLNSIRNYKQKKKIIRNNIPKGNGIMPRRYAQNRINY